MFFVIVYMYKIFTNTVLDRFFLEVIINSQSHNEVYSRSMITFKLYAIECTYCGLSVKGDVVPRAILKSVVENVKVDNPPHSTRKIIIQ